MNGNIFITGGSGFLGRGIMRVAQDRGWKARFTVFSRDELKQDKCKQKYPDAKYVLGDICDTDRLSVAMVGHDIVIHTAALKYIPEGEVNVSECVRINIGGAQSVIRAARIAKVGKVVGISTDKAVCPINVYGMSKALMERLFAEASTSGDTKFTCCRYGNVVGSTGSVIPLFQRQCAEKGYITVTDPEMTRFWISIDEAVDLIEYTLNAPAGSVVIPQPRSMKLIDLAHSIFDEVKIIGLRPGEKIHEDLLSIQETFRTVKSDNYWLLMPTRLNKLPSDIPSVLNSASPSSWVSVKEMQDMIIDAGRV